MAKVEPQGIADFFSALRRRAGVVIVTAVLVFSAAVAAALLWPPTYQSTATILMEEPAVPRDLVRSTITSYADQRVQVITQRVMATSNLVRIIDRHNLYAEKRAKEPISMLINDMRDDIKFSLISADVVDPRSGRPMQANIAFTLTFDHGNPQVAQRVLSELVSLYLSENARTRQEKVAETTEFLTHETTKLVERVRELEAKLARFKNEHAGSLPEDVQVNMQRMDRLQNALRDTSSKIVVLEERKIYLKAQLAQVDPHMNFRGAGEEMLPPKERLRLLQSRYITLNARYESGHPDVVRLKREIEALEREVGPVDGSAQIAEELELARAQLASLRRTYSAEHPDIVKLNRKVSGLEAVIKKNGGKDRAGSEANDAAVNPVYLQLQAQLASIDLELEALRSEQAAIEKNIAGFEDRMARSPEVEREYRILMRNYQNATVEYQQVKTKLMEAELGRSLEAASKSERLSVIEPPTSPAEPISPNRMAILILGFVLSVGSGGGLASLLEATSTKVYGARQLATIAGSPPLAIIPEIVSRSDRLRNRGKWVLIILCGLAVVAGAAAIFQIYVMPLDVLWFRTERRLLGIF